MQYPELPAGTHPPGTSRDGKDEVHRPASRIRDRTNQSHRMFRTLQTDTLAAPYGKLLKSLHEGILEVIFLAPDAAPPADAGALLLPLQGKGGRNLGTVKLQLAAGTDVAACALRVQPALDCLVQTLASARELSHNDDLRMLRLANELDLDFRDDARLD